MTATSVSATVAVLLAAACIFFTNGITNASASTNGNEHHSNPLAGFDEDMGTSGFENTNVVHVEDLSQLYNFVVVSDLDKAARDPQDFLWHSNLQRGYIRAKSGVDDMFTLTFVDTLKAYTRIAMFNRSMELSEIVKWRGNYYTMCDITGLVYQVKFFTDHVLTYQRFTLADGDGYLPKPFKSEWAAIKFSHSDGTSKMVIGSHGKEWVKDGKIMGNGSEYVKVVDEQGRLFSYDWTDKYKALRQVTGTTYPGYLTHEAVFFHHLFDRWIFLPRKMSKTGPYDDTTDELNGTNLLLIATRDFKKIEVRTVGPFEHEWGFSAVRMVPDHPNLIMAVKTKEIGMQVQSKITVFNMKTGKIVLSPEWVMLPPGEKYEGLEFL